MAERLTNEDLDGIARFGAAMESDQQAMAAELLAYRQAARATDKESLTVVTAPDLDELARLLARKTSAAPGSYECGMASAALRDAAEAALPALLATARRERRYRCVLAELRDGEWGPASYKARATLAEEGQDG